MVNRENIGNFHSLVIFWKVRKSNVFCQLCSQLCFLNLELSQRKHGVFVGIANRQQSLLIGNQFEKIQSYKYIAVPDEFADGTNMYYSETRKMNLYYCSFQETYCIQTLSQLLGHVDILTVLTPGTFLIHDITIHNSLMSGAL